AAGLISRSKHWPTIATELRCSVDWLVSGRGVPPPWAGSSWSVPRTHEAAAAVDGDAGDLPSERTELVALAREQQRQITMLVARLLERDDRIRLLEAELARIRERQSADPGTAK
ncbi:MAG TPA: hypothetical protein VD838_08170, partial [Anaeromyxobacteraceae bacterium]|nr:hypothetical protein [Anaeromyxobacteraceae bacterium]